MQDNVNLFMNYLCTIRPDFSIQCFDWVILEIGLYVLVLQFQVSKWALFCNCFFILLLRWKLLVIS